MSAEAASLPCPICSHTGVFQSVQSLRDKLIAVSTNKITCPVCQEEVVGIDKLTIHLFSHVNLVSKNEDSHKIDTNVSNPNPKSIKQTVSKVQQKKSKPITAKNKSTTTPVKFVKIFPKLPVIALNPVPLIDIRSQPSNESVQASKSIYIPAVKTEASHPITQTNTTCNVCGLQFVDANILRMHKCLIHNIEESSNINSTRYHCHICPKNFKMRGSLMVHLRVAHFGFPTNTNETESHTEKSHEHSNHVTDDKPTNIERNDNKQWQCDVCRKCFTTKYFLKKHKRLHTGETPYACTQCNKTFTFQQSYHKHLLYHNDEKPHVCSYCGRAFKELSTLHNHQRIHTGEKPFSCETCGKCFRQRVSYLVHRRIHTGVMPYKCTACEKSFRYKVSQRTHKCQAQPPGTVVRQSGDLVEKLRKKCVESIVSTNENQEQINIQTLDLNHGIPKTVTEVSEANAELVLVGAKLSLEDMESESFTLIAEAFQETHNETDQPSTSYDTDNGATISNSELPFNDLIESGKNVPSPSEIFEKLCLSKDDDYINDLPDVNESNCKDFDIFL